MSAPKPRPSVRIAVYAALVGAVLSLVCEALPHEHRDVCRAVAKLIPHLCGL